MARQLWRLARRQHGVVTRRQLLALGFPGKAIEHRLAIGRLHPVRAGVYAVGRPELTQLGCWMAAVLACGPGAALGHQSAAALWGIRPAPRGQIEVAVSASRRPRRPGTVVHREQILDATTHLGIPVTTPLATLIALATRVPRDRLEAAINEADKLDLIDPESLRRGLEPTTRRPGVKTLRQTLDRRTFTLTDSEPERRFLPLAKRAGLPKPQTQRWVNGFRVDFYWPELKLIVETDGLRHHHTHDERGAADA
jgi:hypothetical protein